MDLDLEQGMRLQRVRQEVADPRELGVGDGADAHPSDHLALERAGAAAQRLRGVDHLFGGGQEPAAGGREHHAAGDALEQADAELVLERLDLGADGGLADMQALRGPGEVPELGDRGKAAQLV